MNDPAPVRCAVVGPATEEQVTEFKDCGPEAVNDAVARAKASFESGVWRDKPPSERAKILWRIGELIDENAEVLAELESLNAGMTPLQAQGTVTVGSEFFRYYAGWCTKIEGIAADIQAQPCPGLPRSGQVRRRRGRHRRASARPQGLLRPPDGAHQRRIDQQAVPRGDLRTGGAVIPFDDEDEAVALANDSTYGLAATAWTSDLGRAHRIAKRLEAGTVGLNCQMQFDHSMPFGGYKQSGWGYESGKAGLETYLQTKIVWAQM